MKKTFIHFILAFIILASCTRSNNPPVNPPNPVPPTPAHTIIGKWFIQSVTTYFYDSTGLRTNGTQVYPGIPGSYFQFNADHTWLENLSSDTISNLGITGSYNVNSDTTFILSNPSASDEICNILSLADTLFSFSHEKPTVFNGTDPGYIKYVFRLTK